MAVLTGLRVLELAQGWAGPLCGRLLGELGADVLKVEPPEGDPLRSVGPEAADGTGYAYHLVNPGKRSVVVDATHQDGEALLRRLAERADIILEGDPPLRWMPPFELGHPGQIRCAVTPFGRTGPLAGIAACDLTVQARAGIMAVTGYPTDPPTRVGPTVADHAAALFGLINVLAALHSRHRSGRGQFVDVAGYDCMVSYLTAFLPQYLVTGTAPPRLGNRHTTIAPWNAYPTRDGAILLCANSDAHWGAVLAMIGREDLRDDPRFASVGKRREAIDAVDETIASWTRTRTTREVIAAAEGQRLAVGEVADLAHLLEGEQFRMHGMVRRLPVPSGEVAVPGSVLAPEGSVERAAPLLGEGGAEGIASWLGRSATDIGGRKAEEVLGS